MSSSPYKSSNFHITPSCQRFQPESSLIPFSMSKKVLVILFTLAGLALEVVGQTEFRTNGTSGQTCGKFKRHCLTSARCNVRKARCYCKRPLTGNGRLGCFPPGDAVAFLQMDPSLKGFDKHYVNLPTPCRYKVVHYSMATPNGARASAEVYAKNIMSKNGEYYVMNALVIISVMTESKVGKHSILLEGSAIDGQYTFVTTVLEDSMTKASLKLQMDFKKYTILVSVDKVNNLINTRVDGLGLNVAFRPPSTPLEDNQVMIPGVTVAIDKDVVGFVKFVNGTLSSSPGGPSIKSQAQSMGLDVQQYVYLLAIFNTPAILMDDRMCQDTTIIFKNICKSDASRIKLLETCSSLYYDKKFLSCFYEKRKHDEIDLNNKLFFRYCAQAFCLQSVDFCTAMMQRIETTRCQLPSTLRHFKCSAETLRLAYI